MSAAALLSDPLLLSILATGFGVVFLHAALPTHWLPFALVGRAQGWTARRTLSVAALAGAGHILFTVVLGAAIVALGRVLDQRYSGVLELLTGALLICLGLYYLLRPVLSKTVVETDQPRRYGSDRAAIIGLVVLLTFSPCEAFLPVFLSGARYGLVGFLALAGVLTVATFAAMMLFTSVAIAGAYRFRLDRLARYESLVIGLLLCLLGVVLIVLP
ncbi:MAG: hypothetical protein ACXW3D_04105 [Caulobacteraceae bacterium]